MRTNGGAVMTRALLACVVVLLVAGVLSTTVVDRQPATSGGPDRQVGVAGLDGSVLVEEPTTTSSAPVTAVQKTPTVPPAASSTAPSTRPPSSTTTTTRKATAPATTVPLTDPNWLTVPNIVPSARWQTNANGVSMRLRIEPAAPVAGQAVRFFMEVSGPGLCCVVSLTFGEGSDHFQVNSSASCTGPQSTPGPHSYVASHTYTTPGAYKARMVAVGGDMCGTSPHDPFDLHWMPFATGYPINACIAVGPGPASDAGCPTNDN